MSSSEAVMRVVFIVLLTFPVDLTKVTLLLGAIVLIGMKYEL